MRSNKYLIPILICILGSMLLVAGCGKSDSNKGKKESENKTVTVTDCIGRSVELPQPLEKVIILNPNGAEAIKILKVQDKVIGVGDTTQQHPYLGMQDRELVGTATHPNYERIVELKPQVVISYSQYPGEELAEKLEPAGIKVVHLQFYKPETYDSDFKTLAKMFGKEKEAEAFLKWKAEKIAILDKVKDLNSKQKVNVFNMTTGDFQKGKWKTNASDTATHQTIEMAGGINTAWELKGKADVSPEWILQQNPGILIFNDHNDELLGFNTNDFGNVQKLKEEVLKNNVLSKTDAVQNNKIYFMSMRIVGGDKSYLGALYLAKWFYPDQFKDMDPEKELKEYFEKWMDVPFQGKWAYPPPK